MKLKQISNGLKCKSCKGYTLDESPNGMMMLNSRTTNCRLTVDKQFLRKFRCRRCLAEFIEVDKQKELSPMEKWLQEAKK